MHTRRDFLQKLAASTIGVSLVADSLDAEKRPTIPEKEKPILRVALMGLGGYASRIAEAMQSSQRTKITALISGTPSKLKEWGAKYEVPQTSWYNYENFDQIGANSQVDAVYILTPNALHCPQALRVAKARKHVICEKPMALNADEGQEMVDACHHAGVKLLVGYRMHFEPHTLEVIRMRREGKLGRLLFFEGLSGFKIGDPGQWRLKKELAGGGSLMDIGIYAVNGARYLIGTEPQWVTAQEIKTNFEKFKEGVDETITFQLGFPEGVVASCLSTYSMNHLDRFFLNGSDGFAVLQPASSYGPIKAHSHKGEIHQPIVNQQTVQMDEMAAIILDGKQTEIPVDGEEGLKDLKIIDKIYAAVKSGARESLT